METKTQGIGLSKKMVRRMSGWALAGAAMVLLAGAAQQAAAQNGKIGPQAPVTYDNRYELFVGLNFQNFMAGQNLPTRMNMGGGEVLATYWLTPRWGPGVEWRGVWGTTPVRPNIVFNGRAEASLNGVLFGTQYRGPKNQYAALNFHAYVGPSYGKFDYTANPTILGMYTNRTAPLAAIGGSVDLNYRKNIAFRLSPDLILERFGTETREFVGVSGGVIWRLGKR